MRTKPNPRFEPWFENLRGFVKIGCIILNKDKQVDFGNAEALEILGCRSRDELDTCLNKMLAGVGDAFDKACGEIGASVRLKVHSAGEPKPRDVFCTVHKLDEECKGWVVLLQDGDALRGFEAAIRDVAQMRTLSRVHATTVHDLKAPIQAMLMTLEILGKGIGKVGEEHIEQQKRDIFSVKEELARLKRALQDSLAEAMPSGSEIKHVDICELIRELARLIAPEASLNDVDLELRLPESEMLVTGHRDHLKQALLNMMLNALDAMANGGKLEVEVTQPSASVEIAMTDTGPGIDENLAKKVFDLHFTTKSTGTGIGLYAARSIIESHRGNIMLQSSAGKGCKFRITLPAGSEKKAV